MHAVIDWVQQEGKAVQDAIRRLDQKSAAKLKQRLKIFLILYIPCIVFLLVSAVPSIASAKTKEKEDAETESISGWVSDTSGDSIYTFTAGAELDEVNDVLGEYGLHVDDLSSTETMSAFADGMGDIFTDMLTYTFGDGELDFSGVGNGFLETILDILFNNIAKFMWKFLIVILRWFLVCPFMMLEFWFSLLGPDFYPGSVFGLIMGRVGSGGEVTTNLFGFELVNGNIYGIVASIIYGLISSVAAIGIAIKMIGAIAKDAWSLGSGNNRQNLKDSIFYNIGSVILLSFLPYLVYIACYARDYLLYEIYKMVEWISGTQSASATSLFLISQRVGGNFSGSSYNPFLDRALSMQEGTMMDSIMYCGSVVLLFVFMFLYVSLALDTGLSFAFAPFSILRGKQAFSEWCAHMAANILTPVIDLLVLSVPLMLGSVAHTTVENSMGVPFLQLIICFSYFPLRRSIQAKLGVNSSSAEGLGMGSMMGGLGAVRLLMMGAGSLAGSISTGVAAAGEAGEAAAGAEAAAAGQLMDAADTQEKLGDLKKAMDSAGGIEGTDPERLTGENPDSLLPEEESGQDIGQSIAGDEQSITELSEQKDELDGEYEGGSTAEDADAFPESMEDALGTDADYGGETASNSLADGGTEGQEKTLADRNIEQATESSRIANESARQASEERVKADHYGNLAAKQKELIDKERAGILSTEEAKKYHYNSSTKHADLSRYKRMQGEATSRARRYGEVQKGAEQVCNNVRARMGIGGHGALSNSEINQYRMAQESATQRNFNTPMMARTLSPELQSKFYREEAKNQKLGVAAGVMTTTALAPIVGAGSIFLPTTAKMAGLGLVASAGGAATKATVQALSSGGSTGTVGITDYGMGQSTVFSGTVGIPADDTWTIAPATDTGIFASGQVSAPVEDVPLQGETLEMVGKMNDYVNSVTQTSRLGCIDLTSNFTAAMRTVLYRSSGKLVGKEAETVGNIRFEVPQFDPGVQHEQFYSVDLSQSASGLRTDDLEQLINNRYGPSTFCLYGDCYNTLCRNGYLSWGEVPAAGSTAYQALLNQHDLRLQIQNMVYAADPQNAAYQGSPANVPDAEVSSALTDIMRTHQGLRTLSREEIFAEIRRNYPGLFNGLFGKPGDNK